MLEAIGILTILGVGVYLLILHVDSKDKKNKLNQKIISKNDKIRDLLDKERRKDEDGHITIAGDLQRKISKILNDPNEVKSTLQKMEEEKKKREDSLKKYDARQREKRKVGYKYEIDIFEIFDISREMAQEEMIAQIEKRYKISHSEAFSIFKEWKDNMLIEQCPWNKKMWEVGSTLTDDSNVIDDHDANWEKWLEQTGKVLKKPSKEEEDYDEKIARMFR